ncbi:bifunctional diaminohydroxyphosphoribosylaminopyrimidine deaminase/5-amino-6-(5-phosphoribosylamino)uracil reductase RibD [Devosia sp.]|uniref:bifunctional diaminohydroxyphosphoribosylaminopyrimidine deaminase/5-amino-6-(5-phosphoribosylamino)uracil reductase RibD n=1 Tax=Devosia sp. TaxID=1871048 RepID=UPI002736F07D|nr:bifunctional diaminohydroxyphosphoribosylaminopyrimidine deaminase/5-amino-6-(5-phosphoribosylamino)uracil reductase RibD [Devosia sp.]MDP2778918.1 bifunctional diaminohydroxyphosphoribosylaminopyrimidine deaminase/5-amino-6-(5-phosphoribosylamino)uracil reductase RibD [Devosia sp.]
MIAAAFGYAVELASQWQGATAPNPPVACVLLDASGETLAAAAHQRAGGPHAEALAVSQCRANDTVHRIHTVVVTLEPCNHTGRTPACTGVILQTPARHIWIGARDPNPLVAGGGGNYLAHAGRSGHALADLDDPAAPKLAEAVTRLIAPFAKHVTTGKPWVTVKHALDRDGSMIPPAGQKTFTSDASLDLAHQLRKRADAVITGSGTILADAPQFTVRRLPDFPGKRRHLVILDRRGRVPPSYVEAAQARGFLVSIEADLATALTELGQAGCLEVLVEAGAELTQSILTSPLWDEHVLIRQHPDPTADDRVTVRYRTNSEPH